MQTAWGKKVEITENSHWEDKVSKNGLSYRTGSVKALVHKDGFVIPVFAKGIITRSGTSTIYTVFVADQASENTSTPSSTKPLRKQANEKAFNSHRL